MTEGFCSSCDPTFPYKLGELCLSDCPSDYLKDESTPNNLSCVKVCPTGYYADFTNKICNICEVNCLNCISNTNCIECNSNFYLNELHTCIDSCPATNYFVSNLDPKQCSPCYNGDNCETCKDYSLPQMCLTCVPPSTLLRASISSSTGVCSSSPIVIIKFY